MTAILWPCFCGALKNLKQSCYLFVADIVYFIRKFFTKLKLREVDLINCHGLHLSDFLSTGIFYWALGVQVSHSYPKVMQKGHAAHSKWFWAKRRNQCESPLLFTRNSGNFLLCFMSKQCPIQAFAFCRKMLHAIWCKFSIKVGGEVMQSSHQPLLKTLTKFDIGIWICI